ncbi:penicillin-binding protein 2A [Polycladomyces abyssicola]|uniref:Penicillin-binding protein 2A n=1 Tax=Polycladomyces abyssicola TaxID=1125966 RepID=A0A8D5ZLZ5_9BACL|nr:PBP1A family penicillin-binding protein [Polycladomyces abyssicola]BCU83039.1 penicillin-binding protein 2A [Polycladomyces abyssicola]
MNSRFPKFYLKYLLNFKASKKWWLLVFLTSFLLVIISTIAVLMVTTVYDLKKMEFASGLYDRNGKRFATLGDAPLEYVKLEDIKSPMLAKAFVAVEDRRFYEHSGVDYKGLARALVKDILTMSHAEGGSTITMQVARNAILDNRDKTIWRKLNEIAIALNLESQYTKDEILEAYINYIYLGNNVRGVKMAAKIYFDKDITKENLSIDQIALLAGLPQSPEGYNPYYNPELAKKRRNIVLKKMQDAGLISEKERELYSKKPLVVDRANLKKYIKKDKYAAYKRYVIEEAKRLYHISEQELTSGGYKVYAGLDPKAQDALEQAMKDPSLFKNHDQLDAGATIVNPHNGQIVAMAGGRNYLPGYINFATQRMQPGSSIKPLTVYAPAIEKKGYGPNTPVRDEPYSVGGYSPDNYDHQFHGYVPLKTVAAKSLNVATVWLLNEKVGLKTAYEYAQKLGLNPDKEDRSLAAMALGGMNHGVNTVQMAQAYSAFANNGQMYEAHAITKIVSRDNDEKDLDRPVEVKQVFSKRTAQLMTKILEYVVQNGTAKAAQLPDGRDVAGKTGTTQHGKEAWFVGYTPEYVMAVAFFNNGKADMVELSGGKYPAKFFSVVMSKALDGRKVSHFKFDALGGGAATWTPPVTDDEPDEDQNQDQNKDDQQQKPPKEQPGNTDQPGNMDQPGDTGQPGGDTGQTGDTGQPGDTGQTGGDTGQTGGDTGQTGGDTGQTGGDTGQTGGDTGQTGGDTGQTGGDTGQTGGDTGQTGGTGSSNNASPPTTP